MRSRFLAFIFMISGAAMASGQNIEPFSFDNPENHLHAGIRGGWEYTLPSALYLNGKPARTFTPGHGVALGGFLHIPVWKNLYVEPGISFYYNTYDYDDLIIYFTDDNGVDYSEIINPEVRKSGFHIPVPVGFHFDFWEGAHVALLTGPQFSMGVTNNVSVNSKYDGLTDLTVDQYGGDGQYRRFDMSWLMGLSGRVRNWRIDITLSIGLLDLHKGAYNFHEYRATTSLCYLF